MAVPTSALLARQVLTSLIQNGVTRFAYCPGSRNAPFAYALAEFEADGQILVQPCTDERSAGFWALGASRASGDPVAVITTSGTAVAEVHPAIEEARYQGLPVIVVTADRPAPMRGVGASQTTRQEGLYAHSVLGWDSFGSDEGERPRQVSDRVRRLLARARGWWGEPGPVHLNVAFSEPLKPAESWQPHALVPGAQSVEIPSRSGTQWEEAVDGTLRTVVIAGDLADPAVGEAADRRGIPILAEPTSGLTQLKSWVPFAPMLLPHLAQYVQQVVVTGHPTLSRPAAALLAQTDARIIVVAQHSEWADVTGNADQIVAALDDTGEATPSSEAWLKLWQQAAVAVESVLAAHADRDLNLLSVCRKVSEAPASPLWIGASNSIRGFHLGVWLPLAAPAYSNRGLAGIDGTVASAWGAATVCGEPLRAVMGDMTFSVDLSTLTQSPTAPVDLQVLVLDDNGAGIFEFLEHADAERGVYEKYFAVPPRVDIEAVAQACGWESTNVDSLEELEDVLAQPAAGRSVVRVPIPRPADLLRKITQLSARALADDRQFQETLSYISDSSA